MSTQDFFPFSKPQSSFTFSLGLFPPTRANSDDLDIIWRQNPDKFPLTAPLTSHLEAQNQRCTETGGTTCYHTRRRLFSQDEFNGPSQLLPLPMPQQEHARSQMLPTLPVHLSLEEQDQIIIYINNVLSRCAFHFVAKYQFPIPIERDKLHVRTPADREWTEWAHLLKRLATKRRIPARVLFDNQIKQFVTTLENSIVVRQNPKGNLKTGTPKDDRHILQLISAATQVAKILMDSWSMKQLDDLYTSVESVILERRTTEYGK